MSPAPSTMARRPFSVPKIFFARSTAAELTDAAPLPIAVSARTRPATDCAVWKSLFNTAPEYERLTSHASRTWPLICASPTTMESRPDVTRIR